MIDVLQHETRCEEFVVFSADADFTPVLRKLRRYDRRTTVLAIGFPSAAYQASADLMIDERLFLREALGFGKATSNPGTVGNGHVNENGEVHKADSKPAAAESMISGTAAPASAKPEPGPKVAPRTATSEELTVIAARIWSAVEESPVPVSAGTLASRLRQEHPDVLENWNGCGSFKAFFRSLRLSRLFWLSGSGGRIMDPSRHELEAVPPQQDAESPWAGAEEAFPVVRDICVLAGAPMLAPRDMKLVLSTLAQVLEEQPFDLSTTSRLVCRRCLESDGLRVRPRDVSFLLRGMQWNGHVFGQGRDDERTLASRVVNQILFLCEREQKVPTQTEIGHIRQWIGGVAAAELAA